VVQHRAAERLLDLFKQWVVVQRRAFGRELRRHTKPLGLAAPVEAQVSQAAWAAAGETALGRP